MQCTLLHARIIPCRAKPSRIGKSFTSQFAFRGRPAYMACEGNHTTFIHSNYSAPRASRKASHAGCYTALLPIEGNRGLLQAVSPSTVMRACKPATLQATGENACPCLGPTPQRLPSPAALTLAAESC